MPAADQEYADVETAALAYGADLVAAAPPEGPWFDVLMLGVGPDGHCASLFPGRSEVEDAAPVLAVRSSPKPPPTRISLGMSTLQRAREVWFVATGFEKAEVVAAAVRGADVLDVPAAGPRGTERTVWFLDSDAAWML
jgi:6-phosphogluconolactonase